MNNRSVELSEKAKDYFTFKSSYTNDTINNKYAIINYYNVDEELWDSYEWQMANRINDLNKIKDIFPNAIINGFEKEHIWSITPYYLSLMHNLNYSDPIYSQVIPNDVEYLDNWGTLDPMDERNTQPISKVTRRYPDRIIINVTNQCFSYCRHCQRKRCFSKNAGIITKQELKIIVDFLNEHSEIRDVLITGGDPFTLSNDYLLFIVSTLKTIKHIEIIRIGTRALSFMPQRIDEKLVHQLKKFSPIYINTQFNHPNELSEEVSSACNLLVDNGIVLGNQSVLLKGVNDNTFVLQLLNQMLIKNRIRPYYLFHPKQIRGTHHFYVSIDRGRNIYNDLRGNTSGLCIPTYIINAPGGYGKVPLEKDHISKDANNNIILTTWENKRIIITDDNEI